jgi:hypothetical protein
MKEVDQPCLQIELGISPESGASLDQLYKRGMEHTRLVVAACAELKHLSDSAFIWRCPLIVVKDMYVLLIPIEPASQTDLEGHGGKRGKLARRLARDAAVQAAIDLTTKGARAAADLLGVVAVTMSTSQNARRELKHLELRTGVDTRPARQFLSHRSGPFNAIVDMTPILFDGDMVRSSQQLGVPVRVKVRLVPNVSASGFERCEVLEVPRDRPLEGITSGGRKDLRFANLEPWQRVVMAGARERGVEFWLQAVNRIGTCSLEYRPADVVELENWRELYAATMAVLQQNQFASDAPSSNDEPDGDASSPRDGDVAAG